MDIFLDFARRMGFTDRDGAPLIAWDTPEGAFVPRPPRHRRWPGAG
jgi:hypothetical protein